MGAALMESLGQIGQHLAPLNPDGYPVRNTDCSGVAVIGQQLMTQRSTPALAQLGAAVMAMLPQIMEVFRQLGRCCSARAGVWSDCGGSRGSGTQVPLR